MQAKNFNPELLSLHPNRGHGTPESALGNSPLSRPVSHKIKLKDTDGKNGSVTVITSENKSHVRLSRQIVCEYASTRVKLCQNPRPNT